jgi:succinate-semialdehyde dehydrogenase/glutarate-semialdehyde dehydrogenase
MSPAWTPEEARTVRSVNPANGAVIGAHELSSGRDIAAALDRARSAQSAWRQESWLARSDALRAIGRDLAASRDELAELITAEMGKTLSEARAEVEKSAWVCEYYADNGAHHLVEDVVQTDIAESFVQYEPLGVVLAIMPWNYPVWQVMRAAAPALMAGNTVVLKHASNVTGCALAIGRAIQRAVPDRSLLEVVVVDSGDVAGLIADERIAAVTLTGSEQAGVSVALACASALKPSVLELGGSDPFIVLEDADLDQAADAAVVGRYLNAGQSCIAAKRFIVVNAVADAFERALVDRVAALRMGDPLTDVDLGPMARADLRDELHDQVVRGIGEGGRILIGGEVVDGPGAFYPPTVVGGVRPGSVLAREETFGPVAAVLSVRDEEEAIAVANDSPYGLSSSLWTEDLDRARRLSRRVEAGAVFVNLPSASDPRMPFGGIKRSGWGRELGPWGIREFVNVQAVSIGPRRG